MLSIVTPTRDQGTFLARCIASVRDQPPGIAEHIVMDGASGDGSVRLLESGAVQTWRSEPDSGQSHAINTAFGVGGSTVGAPRASAEFGTWLNADDWYQPGALGEVARHLIDRPETDVLVCRAKFVGDDGRVIHEPTPPERIDEPSLLMLRSGWFAGHSIVQPEVFFRASLFREVGGVDESNHHSMDHQLWLKFAEAGARFRHLDLHVANQGVHAGQKTADRLAATRSIVRGSRDWLERRGPHWPLRAGEVRQELDALERKLTLAGRYVQAIDQAMAHPGGTERNGTGVSKATPPDAWRAALEALLDEALGAGSPAPLAATIIAEPSAQRAITGILLERGIAADRVVARAAELSPPTPGAPPRAIIAHALLTGSVDPGAALLGVAHHAAPGDLLVISGEVARSEGHDRYVRRLRARIINKITQPDNLVVGPRADLAVVPMLERPGALELHPNPRGIDLESLVRRAGLRCTPIATRPFGRWDNLPLAPFPTIPKLMPGTAEGAAPDEGSHAWRSVAFRVSERDRA